MTTSNAQSRGWTPPQKPEEWLVYLVGGAAGLYIACSLPSVLGPGSAMGALLLLVSGILLGIALVFGGVAAVFFLLTKRASDVVGKQILQLPKADSPDNKSPLDSAEQQKEHDSVVREMLAGAKPRAPPHGYTEGGQYAGWLWTIPSSNYNREESIFNWPPATEGPRALATKWWGSLRNGRLYLARSSGLEASYLVPVEEVDLSGCKVEVLKEALKTKSQWWRKCPIQVSHADRPLLHSETSFALFAEGSAAKEQWYVALRQAAGTAPARQAVEEAYAQFCDQARGRGNLHRYPQTRMQGEAFDEIETRPSSARTPGRGDAQKAQAGRGGGWGRIFTRRRNSPQKGRLGNSTSRSQSPTKPSNLPPGFVNPMELDQAWMGKGAVPRHLAAPAAKSDGPSSPGGHSSDDSRQSPSRHQRAGSAEADRAKLQPPPLRTSSSDPAIADSADRVEKLKVGSKSAHFPLKLETASESEDEGSLADVHTHTATSSVAGGSPPRLRPDSLANEPVTAVEHGVNMMLARLSFDILRSPAFQAELKVKIHRKLNELRIPDYIHGFEVVDIDLGHGVPAIKNLRAAPMPTSTIWPQIMFDLDFEGDITIVIETKLDVRDGAAWSQFDKAIHILEGGAEDSGPETTEPSHAAESEEDGPLSPMSPVEVGEEPGKAGAEKRGFMGRMLPLRQRFAKGIRQLAEVTADHLSKMQLRLRLEVKALKGPLYVWLPPPPGDRLWFSFVTPPQLIAVATPLVGGRLLKYSYQASRVSQWIASKMQSSITKNMVFPSCSDIPIPFLLSLDNPHVGYLPASLLRKDGEGGSPSKSPAATRPGQPSSLAEAVVSKAAQAVIETPPAPASATGVDVSSNVCSSSAADLEPASLQPGKAAVKKPDAGKGGANSKKGFWGRKKASQPNNLEKPVTKAKAKTDTESPALELQELKPGRTPLSDDSAMSPAAVHEAPSNKAASEHRTELQDLESPVQTEGEPLLSQHARLEQPAPESEPAAELPAPSKEPVAREKGLQAREKLVHPEVTVGDRSNTEGSTKVFTAPDPAASVYLRKLPFHQKRDLLHDRRAKSRSEPLPESKKSCPQEAAEKGPGNKETLLTQQLPVKAEASSLGKGLSAENVLAAYSLEAAEATAAAVQKADRELTQEVDPDGWLGAEPEVLEPSKVLEQTEPSSEGVASLCGPPMEGIQWTSADQFFQETPSAGDAGRADAPESAPPYQALADACETLDPAAVEAFLAKEAPLTPSSSFEGAGESPTSDQAEASSHFSGDLRGSHSWQQRLNATGTVMQKNWEAFKFRNPHTMQQGKKFAGAMEKLRGQAQEHIRKTQEQLRKSQEQRKSQKLLGPQKPSVKEA